MNVAKKMRAAPSPPRQKPKIQEDSKWALSPLFYRERGASFALKANIPHYEKEKRNKCSLIRIALQRFKLPTPWTKWMALTTRPFIYLYFHKYICTICGTLYFPFSYVFPLLARHIMIGVWLQVPNKGWCNKKDVGGMSNTLRSMCFISFEFSVHVLL